MSNSLNPQDRRILILCGVFVVVASFAAALWVPQPQSSPKFFPSSYSAAQGGAKAAYLLLSEMGYQVERWSRPPLDLPAAAEGIVLILADPWFRPSFQEKSQIVDFVRRGGVVLATGPAGAEILSMGPVVVHVGTNPSGFGLAPEVPGRISWHVPEIRMETATRLGLITPDQVEYYGDPDGAAVVSFAVGRGHAVWWASSFPLTNDGLEQASNLELFLNSVNVGASRRVLWDEYFHGERAGLGSYFARTPAPWALAQGLILFAALLLTFGRRNGPIRPLARKSRLSPLEFVETLGELYRRKRAASAALGIVFNRFRHLAAGRLGLPPSAPPIQIADRASSELGWKNPQFAAMLAECDLAVKSSRLREDNALRLMQGLQDWLRRLGLATTNSEEWQ